MEQDTKELGSKIGKMEKELKHGLMEQGTKVCIRWERNMVMATLNGLMVLHIQVNFLTTIFTVKEFMNGLMVGDLRETGKTTRWMAEVFSNGQIIEGMRENTETIRKRVKDILHGLMADNT